MKYFPNLKHLEDFVDFNNLDEIKERLVAVEVFGQNIPLLDRWYIDIIREIIHDGEICGNRTANRTMAISGAMIKHDMSKGFPLLTTKKIMVNAMAVELEGFIKGITDKAWYKGLGCNLWNDWCNPKTLNNILSGMEMVGGRSLSKEEIEAVQAEENDLGKIYGYQLSNFGGVNQLSKLIERIVTHPECRRHIVSAWNPAELGEMALPPCHVLFQINRIGDKLDLVWYQRSVDVPLGLPFNISSYALLLSIICKVTGNVPGSIIGMLSNVHIYENQLDGVCKHLEFAATSDIHELPRLVLEDLESVYDFDSQKSFKIEGYNHGPFIKIPVSV